MLLLNNLLSIVTTIYFRDWVRFKVERSRWLGAVGQPMLFWAMLGFGIGDTFRAPNGQGYASFFFPGALAMVVLFTAMFACMSIIDDRNNGFLQSVLVLPESRLGVLIGKTISIVSLTIAQVGLYLLAAPLAGIAYSEISYFSLFISLILGTAGLSLFSLAGAWLINSVAGYHGIMALILFPMWLMSGALFPLDTNWKIALSWINPLAYFVAGIRLSFAGGSLFDVTSALPVIGMLVVLAASFFVAINLMKRTGVSVV